MVAHNTLTGAELHEAKGADVATANTVLVANGAGSASFQALTTAQIGSNLRLPRVIIEDQKAPGVGGPGSIIGINQRPLGWVVANSGGLATIASNRFTLPAGTYYIDFWTTFLSSGGGTLPQGRASIFNFTDSVYAIAGSTQTNHIYYNISGSSVVTNISKGAGIVTIPSTKTFELRFYSTVALAGTPGISDGLNEVYSHVEIW
jgi:hypothetical protein